MKQFSDMQPLRLIRTGASRFMTAVVLLAASMLAPATAQDSLDRIVAVVNDGVIMQSELESSVRQVRRRLGEQISEMPEPVVQSRVLDQLIIARLQTQRAERAGLRVSDREINTALQRTAGQNGMNVNEFFTRLAQEGVTQEDIREQIREQMLLDKIKEREVYGRVQVTEQDVDRFLESESLRLKDDREYHIRHILVEAADDASAESIKAAERRAQEIKQRAESGEAFSDLAIAFSEGAKALEGGDLGWLPGGYMPTLFADIVPQLDTGEVSPVFRGPGGFHLIKLEEIRATAQSDAPDGPVMVEEVNAQHLMIERNELRDSARAREEIQKLRERLLAGDDFSDLAREYSDDDASSNQGGDLGWVQVSNYPPAFANQLEKLEAGQLGEPFETDLGWHMLKVVEWRERDRTRERIRSRARQAIGQRMAEEEGESWLRRLRDEAYVEVRLEDYQGEADQAEGSS